MVVFCGFSEPVGPDSRGVYTMTESLKLLNLTSGSTTMLASHSLDSEITGRNFANPAISPDGRYVAYGHLFGGDITAELFLRRLNRFGRGPNGSRGRIPGAPTLHVCCAGPKVGGAR